MKRIHWSPARDLCGFHGDVDRLRNSSIGELPATNRRRGVWAPPADLRETREGFEMRLDLPGIEKKDIKVSVFGDTVTVSGERHGEVNEEGKTWHRVERFDGVFERQFVLGAALDSGKVRAVYRDGVLSITVAKAESAKPKEIAVEVGE